MRINKMAPSVTIPVESQDLSGELQLLPEASCLVLFANVSGNARNSSGNQYVARILRAHGCSTLLFDLFTPGEEEEDQKSIAYRFDIGFLTRRLITTTCWVARQPWAVNSNLGYFGTDTGAAAALIAAATLETQIGAIVSRSGRPDFSKPYLPQVQSPTLFIVGGRDEKILQWNEQAYRQMTCKKDLKVVHGATHLFEEKAALQEVAREAGEWFRDHLTVPRITLFPVNPTGNS